MIVRRAELSILRQTVRSAGNCEKTGISYEFALALSGFHDLLPFYI